jgi:hypothetical protein
MRAGTIGSEQITRRAFYYAGGFAHPRQWRRMRGGSWQYFYRHD